MDISVIGPAVAANIIPMADIDRAAGKVPPQPFPRKDGKGEGVPVLLPSPLPLRKSITTEGTGKLLPI
jgi:hypothetical protein